MDRLKKLGDKNSGSEQPQKSFRTTSCLKKTKKTIIFNNMAQEAGVTKATLYSNSNIRERIEALRYQQAQVPTPAQVEREMDENKQLKDSVKINSADIYRNI